MNISLLNYLQSIAVFLALNGCFVLFILFLVWRRRHLKRFSPFTENIPRLPGHSLREKHETLVDRPMMSYLWYSLFFVILVGSWLFVSQNGLRIGLVLFGGGGVVYILIKVSKLFERIQDNRLGCEGEEYVGQELNLLMLEGAYVFHDIPYQYGNIDHIVIGNNTAFVIETKTVRKPKKPESEKSRMAEVVFDGLSLAFPHFRVSEPLDQVRRHAKHLEAAIRKKCGFSFPVKPVIALPGWYVKTTADSDILVINPKRGRVLRKWVGETDNKEKRNRVVNYVASVAYSIQPRSKRFDPDYDEYDIWTNPKFEEKILGD